MTEEIFPNSRKKRIKVRCPECGHEITVIILKEKEIIHVGERKPKKAKPVKSEIPKPTIWVK